MNAHLCLIKSCNKHLVVYKYFLILLICLSNVSLSGQDRYLGLSVGGALYSGDLDPISRRKYLKNVGLSYGIFYRQEISKRFGIRLNLQRLNLSASDAIDDDFTNPDILNRFIRNLSFRNSLTEFSVLAEVKLFELLGFSFHFVAGPAIFRHDPEAIDPATGNYVSLQPLGTEGQTFEEQYSLFQVALPFGGIMKRRLSDNMSLQVEILARLTNTDYIDDVSSQNYFPYEDFILLGREQAARLADPFNPPMGLGILSPSQDPNTTFVRGNPQIRDYYFSSSFSIIYTLPNLKGGDVLCPIFY